MSQAQLYLYDPSITDRIPWRPATVADFNASLASGSPQAPVNGNVTTSASNIAEANGDRTAIYIHNHATNTGSIKVNFGADATTTSAIYQIDPGITLDVDSALAKTRISAIAMSGAAQYTILEVLNG